MSLVKTTLYGPLVEMVNTPACHAGDQGFETPTGRHKVCSQYLVAENLGVEEETKDSLCLATVVWL